MNCNCHLVLLLVWLTPLWRAEDCGYLQQLTQWKKIASAVVTFQTLLCRKGTVCAQRRQKEVAQKIGKKFSKLYTHIYAHPLHLPPPPPKKERSMEKGKTVLHFFPKEQLKYKTSEAFDFLFGLFLKSFHLWYKHPLEQASDRQLS